MSGSEQTDYSKIMVEKPEYKLLRLTQQSGGTSAATSAAGSVQSVFEIPARVFNLSKSHLQFTITAAAQVADFVAIIQGGTHAPIRDINLFSQSGLRIASLPNVGKTNKAMLMSDTKYADFKTRSQESGFAASNVLGAAEGNYQLHVADNVDPVLTANRTSGARAYQTPVGYTTSGADNTALAITFRVPLSDFKNSIFDLDKDLYMDQILTLQIDWAPWTQSVVDGDTAPLANQGAVVAATLTNLYMYLAVEKNEDIARQVRDQVKSSGLKVLIDYPYHYNQNLTGTSHSLSYRFNRAHGRRLKRIYMVPYIGSSAAGTNYWNHARDQAGEAVTELYTQLDNERLQQWTLDSTAQDEYLIMEDKLKGSVVADATMHDLNYFYVDSWDNLKFHEREPEKEQGLDLSVEHKWDAVVTAEAQRNYYVAAIVQRMMTITSEGISLD